jgi:hypothetical protein
MTCGLKDVIGGHYVTWSKTGSETERPHVFSYTWEIDLNDKNIHKNKHDQI